MTPGIVDWKKFNQGRPVFLHSTEVGGCFLFMSLLFYAELESVCFICD